MLFTGGIWVAADGALFALRRFPFAPEEREVQAHVGQQAMQPIIGIELPQGGSVLVLMVCIAAAAPMHAIPMQPGFWVHVGLVFTIRRSQSGVNRLDGVNGVDAIQAVLVHELRGSFFAFGPQLLPLNFRPLLRRVQRAFAVVDQGGVHQLHECFRSFDPFEEGDDGIAVDSMVAVLVDALPPILIKRVVKSQSIYDFAVTAFDVVNVPFNPRQQFAASHGSVGLTGRRVAIDHVVFPAPSIMAHKLCIAHKGDDAVNRRFHTGAAAPVITGGADIDDRGDGIDPIGANHPCGGGGGGDVGDVGGGVGVGIHCLGPSENAPHRGRHFETLGKNHICPPIPYVSNNQESTRLGEIFPPYHDIVVYIVCLNSLLPPPYDIVLYKLCLNSQPHPR